MPGTDPKLVAEIDQVEDALIEDIENQIVDAGTPDVVAGPTDVVDGPVTGVVLDAGGITPPVVVEPGDDPLVKPMGGPYKPAGGDDPTTNGGPYKPADEPAAATTTN
ncbi:hypothetical protein [Saccharothrix syringae]|uniref:Uncharacterized protein n=1 Tax=Saccharothrix syringae TaxID=103733 RepID=A0A5Q0HA94_SACSY|nr:hypothetical protein [Saccharothrix syringae]QFZ22855.1 hypothetical protein EKG83_40365 [Saccharothrix syringae]